jgi:type 1 fimbria pilin
VIAAKGIEMSTRIAITTSALVALCATHLIAHAETVSITGDIQGETCVLESFVNGVASLSKNITLPLEDVPLTTLSDKAAAGSVFGKANFLNFNLVNQDGSSCTSRNGASGWDISIAPAKTGYITTINGATFLSNMVSLADGGTNAVVKLSGFENFDNFFQITLTEAGSYVSSPSDPFKTELNSSMSLFAQFAFPVANQKPTSGVYSSTLTLAVTYR